MVIPGSETRHLITENTKLNKQSFHILFLLFIQIIELRKKANSSSYLTETLNKVWCVSKFPKQKKKGFNTPLNLMLKPNKQQ